MSPKADPSGSAFFYVFVGAIHESPAIVKMIVGRGLAPAGKYSKYIEKVYSCVYNEHIRRFAYEKNGCLLE
jgi:hypothetical protein